MNTRHQERGESGLGGMQLFTWQGRRGTGAGAGSGSSATSAESMRDLYHLSCRYSS